MFASFSFRSLTLAVLVVFSALPAFAGIIQGTVRERGTRVPVPGATLYLQGGSDEVISDENGEYIFRSVKGSKRSNAVTLHVESEGYENFVVNVNLQAKGTTKYDPYLTPTDDDFSSVVRERRSVADQSRGAHRISEAEVNEQPGTFGDPAKAIENFPGMGRVQRSQGSLFVRGAQPDDTGVYVDGFEIPDLYHFTGSTSVINIPFVESVQLVPGAFSSRFGRATGGLVTLNTRRLPTDAVHGFAKIDVIDAGAYVGVPLSDDAAIGISARRSYLDAFRQIQRKVGDAQNEITLIPTYWDYQAKLDWDVQSGHELTLFVFGSGDREFYFRDRTETTEPYLDRRDSDFHRISGRYKNTLSGGFTNEFTAVLGYEDRRRDIQEGERRSTVTGVDLQVREELRYVGDENRITVGVDTTARVDTVTFEGAFAGGGERDFPLVDDAFQQGETQSENIQALTGALYAEGTFEPMKNLILTPGVRFQAYGLQSEPLLSLEPRFAGQYTFFKDSSYSLALRAAGGVFSRAPKADEIFVAGLYGRDLSPQNALHLQVGFEQAFSDLGFFSLTFFSIWRDHVVQTTDDFPLVQQDFPLSAPLDANSAGRSYGTEAIVRLAKTTRYFAWASYSITRHDRIDSFGTVREPKTTAINNDTSHLLTLVGQLELLWGFRAGLRYRAVTGMPFTPIASNQFDADSGRYIPVLGERNSQRFETFHGLDFRLDWSILLTHFELGLYADLVNVLNIRPREGTEYHYDFTEERPINGLPSIPNIGLKVTF